MKQNRNNYQISTARRLRRMKEEIGYLRADLQFLQRRINWVQSQINSRNELEMDLAIDRLKFAAKRQLEIAKKEKELLLTRYAPL